MTALEAIADAELTDDESRQLFDAPKMVTFLGGLLSLRTVYLLQDANLKVCSMKDTEYLMDFEALQSESKQIAQEFQSIQTQLRSVLPAEKA